ncbi:MAG: DivIVA domain-containing protein [Firmicutes bacterium]|nr:DivIVA domain-containing protein [Bacillota bacterium]
MSLVDPKELDAEIHARGFDRVIKGYNPEQVNGFLNRILRPYKNLYIRNKELEEELEKVKKEQDGLKETFFHAQETANQIIAEARQAGEEERNRAAREADQILQNAKDRAEELYLTIVLQNEKYKDAVNKLVDQSYAISKTHIQALANELFHKMVSWSLQ